MFHDTLIIGQVDLSSREQQVKLQCWRQQHGLGGRGDLALILTPHIDWASRQARSGW